MAFKRGEKRTLCTPNNNKANDIGPVSKQLEIHSNRSSNQPCPSPPRVRAIKLETVRDVRKFLSRLINKTYRDEVNPTKAGRLGQLAGILLKTIELTDIEQRVSELEEKITTHEDFPPPD